MKIGISNLAWPAEDDEAVGAVLVAAGIREIDVAPGRYAHRAAWPSNDAVANVRAEWHERAISIGALQSLYHGHPDLNVFGDARARAGMLTRLREVCTVAEGLGATRLVFGSAANRARGPLREAEAWKHAVRFLRAAGDECAAHGLTFCVEAAPTAYGGDFAVTTEAAASWVMQAQHWAVRLQLDIGIAALGNEPLDLLLERFGSLVGHVHLSEPGLAVLGEGGVDHATAAAALRRHLPEMGVTIEMLTPPGQSALSAVTRAVAVARQHYGGD